MSNKMSNKMSNNYKYMHPDKIFEHQITSLEIKIKEMELTLHNLKELYHKNKIILDNLEPKSGMKRKRNCL